jgi:lysophospholipase L1-like esterase
MKIVSALRLILTACALSGSWTPAQTTNDFSPPAQHEGPPIRVACVGDSITEGYGSTNPYPAQLQKLLGEAWDVHNFGLSGRTLLKKGDSPYWNEKAYADAKALAPNVVIIMLGTNDTKLGNWKFFDQFAADYKEMVESFKSLPSQPKIFVCRPCPVFGAGNYGITETNLDQEMPLIDEVARDEGATVVDIHAALADKPQLLGDRVHPDADGDAVIAKTLAAALTAK